MIYVANPSSKGGVNEAMSARKIAAMTTPKQGNVLPVGCQWAADNGRFGKGWPGEDEWWAWLGREVARYGAGSCLFATAPDVIGDFVATWDMGRHLLGRIRSLGIPAAYVAQDGSAPDWLIPWDDLDVLFLGGSTEFKLGPHAEALAAEAVRRGKWVHMGRVNSLRRLRLAQQWGCSSVDGTYLTFGPVVNLPRVLGWLDQLAPLTG